MQHVLVAFEYKNASSCSIWFLQFNSLDVPLSWMTGTVAPFDPPQHASAFTKGEWKCNNRWQGWMKPKWLSTVADVHDLVSCDVYTQPLSLWFHCRLIEQCPFREQTWQGRASSSGLTQQVRRWESLACLR